MEFKLQYWSIPISHLCLCITNANFVICDLRRSDMELVFLAHRDTKNSRDAVLLCIKELVLWTKPKYERKARGKVRSCLSGLIET